MGAGEFTPFSFEGALARVRAGWSVKSPWETTLPTPRKFNFVDGYAPNTEKMLHVGGPITTDGKKVTPWAQRKRG